MGEKEKRKQKGLRETPYMASWELVVWMKLAILSGELDACVSETKNKKWHKKLACANTMLWSVIQERIAMTDPKQAKSIVRRKNHSDIISFTSDEKRLPKNKNNMPESVTLAYEDFIDIIDLANNSCVACKQGPCVDSCFYKKVFLRCGVPILRPDAKEGECPYSTLAVGETRQVIPRNQRNEHYYEDDYAL